MRNSAGIVADGDRDRDRAGKFKADQSRRQGKPGTLDTDFLPLLFVRDSETIQHGTRPEKSEPIRKGNAAGKDYLSSETMPEHWTNTADPSRPYSELLKAIHAKLICHQLGRNASKGPGQPQKAIEANYSHGKPETLEEYHSRK